MLGRESALRLDFRGDLEASRGCLVFMETAEGGVSAEAPDWKGAGM